MMAKTVYFAMTTHPNMNYDRSVKSVIWEAFPKLYRLYLNYLRDHDSLKSHMQLPPQTLLSLKQCAPDVIELAQRLRDDGRLRFMGTFFSESIAQCQDGMSVLEAARLGCGIAAAELDAELEGFFLQEIAYTPQLPYMIEREGVQWTILRDWEHALRPFWIEGLDGTRCVGVPLAEGPMLQDMWSEPERIPDHALIITHCDMEIPVTLKRMHMLEQHLNRDVGYHTQWCFVSDYLREVGVDGVKRPTPCTNKAEGTTASPSFSRWCADHLSMDVHRETLAAMEARRGANLTAFGDPSAAGAAIQWPDHRPYPAWNVETPAIYPELEATYLRTESGQVSPFKRMAMLIAWGCNSDGRGWYPLLERRMERTDSLNEAAAIGDRILRQALLDCSGNDVTGGASLCAVNAHGIERGFWHTLTSDHPLDVLDAEGNNAVEHIERDGTGWRHHLRLHLPAYTSRSWTMRDAMASSPSPEPGNRITNDTLTLVADEGVVSLEGRGQRLDLQLAPFQICVKCLDTTLRVPEPENDWSSCVIGGTRPRLILTRQLDYHVHFRAEYVLDGDAVLADWRFWFTYPTLVNGLDTWDAEGPKTDFSPGGLCAMLTTGKPGRLWYDAPFGVVQHPNEQDSFVAPLTHAFLANGGGGVAAISRDGSQCCRTHASAGRLGLCMGTSITSGGRRKLGFRIGETIDDFAAETDWYKEFFYGERQHRFVILPFGGDWRDLAVPAVARALATGPRVMQVHGATPAERTLARLTPHNVRLAGIDPDQGRVVLNEICGRECAFNLRIGNAVANGTIGPFGICDIPLEKHDK